MDAVRIDGRGADFFQNLMGLLVAGNYQEGIKLLQVHLTNRWTRCE